MILIRTSVESEPLAVDDSSIKLERTANQNRQSKDDNMMEKMIHPTTQNKDDKKIEHKTGLMRKISNTDSMESRMSQTGNKFDFKEKTTAFAPLATIKRNKDQLTSLALMRKKRNPGCMRQCLLLRLLHPSQCHFIC
jgi:hypothetical protein